VEPMDRGKRTKVNDRWVEVIDGHKCECVLRSSTVYVTVTGTGFFCAKSCPAWPAARAEGLKLCRAIVAERTAKS
jgi:hypothetical protein